MFYPLGLRTGHRGPAADPEERNDGEPDLRGVDYRSDGSRGDDRFNDRYHHSLSFGAGEAKTQVQDIINDILPCMLPLVSFGIVYWLLGRKVKPLSIIGGMALVGILGSWIGLF